jgi:uncharacterized protein
LNLSLFLNHQCNLRCRYCYGGRKFDRAMPLPLAKKAVDFGFERAGNRHLTLAFFGGEPMLELDLMAAVAGYAVDEARRRDMSVRFSLSTNGTLLDDAHIRFLKDFSVYVQVSVDGGAPAQDLARPFADGAGSSIAVDRNLRRLAREGLVHQLVAVMTPATVPWLVESFRHLVSLDVPEIYFAADFTGDWSEAACARFETEFHALTDAYAELFRAGVLRRVDPLYGKIVTHLIRGRQMPRRCGFGQDELAVSPQGRIYPCDRMVREDENPDYVLGDLSTGVDEARLRALQDLRRGPDPECATCDLRQRCCNWCGCAQYETTGALGRVSPLFCWSERLFIAEADRLASALFAERNPTFLRDLYKLEPVIDEERGKLVRTSA